MASFANLNSNLNLNIQNFSRGLAMAAYQAKRFAQNLNGNTVTPIQAASKATWKWGLNLKSVSRVVSGILISQTFYKGVQQIQAATQAVWEFSKELETAHVAYSNLFGDSELAAEFINVLKDFAAKTPFSFTEAEKSAKRLLAYGIEYKNVMYVMQGVLSAASIQGDSTKIEAISRALGQIFTYGKLMTQEVRQLSEAGIPAYEILQEELGLTADQLANLGKQGIPAADAINALVDGIQKRFGTAADAAALTTTGIISNIKDNAQMLFANIFGPFSTFIKSAMAELGEFLFYLRDLSETGGLGAVFEAIVPEELQGTLRQFVANLQSVLLAIVRLAVSISGLLKPVLSAVIALFNAFAPIIAVTASTMAELITGITSSATAMKWLTGILAAAAAMWVIYTIKALASAIVSKVIIGVANALLVLRSALNFVVAHPFWALLIALGGILIGLSVGFSDLGKKVNNFFKSLTSFSGVDPDKVLLPSQKERANDLDKFNKRLSGTANAMEDLADSTGKATKAAKGLLSFDEVFKLNQPDESGHGIETDDLSDLFEALEGLGSGYMPEVPDFSDYLGMFKSNFLEQFQDMWNAIKDNMTEIMSLAIFGAIGGLAGWLLGGSLGGAIGIIAGLIVGYFWNKLADAFNLTPEQRIRAGIIGGVGTALGTVLGLIIGGPLGAKIGGVIGGIVGSFWGLLAEKLGVIPEQHIATLGSTIVGFFTRALSAIGANVTTVFIGSTFSGFARTMGLSWGEIIIGGLKAGVLGAITSLAVGVLSNALAAWLVSELDFLSEDDLVGASIGQFVGSIIGSIIGMIVGGPMGSIIGGAIGQLAGTLAGLFWDSFVKYFVVGFKSELSVKDMLGIIGEDISAWYNDKVAPVLDSIKNTMQDTWGAVIGTFNESRDAVNSVHDAIWSKVEPVWNDISAAITTVLDDIKLAIDTVLGDIKDGITTVSNDVWTVVSDIWALIRDIIVKVLEDIWNAVVEFFAPIIDVITEKLEEIKAFVSEWVQTGLDWINEKLEEIKTTITEAFTSVLDAIKEKLEEIKTFISDWVQSRTGWLNEKLDELKAIISDWLRDILNSISEYFSEAYEKIKESVTEAYNEVTRAFSGMYTNTKESLAAWYDATKEGIANIYKEFTDWISNMYDNVFGKFFSWIGEGIDKLREFFGLGEEASKVQLTTPGGASNPMPGHASGGIFNREHLARFAEGNKAEAIIPLEESSAMQPFVDAVANGLTASLAPILANMNNSVGQMQPQMQPLYVGTLIADDRSLKELERKMEVIRLQESRR